MRDEFETLDAGSRANHVRRFAPLRLQICVGEAVCPRRRRYSERMEETRE